MHACMHASTRVPAYILHVLISAYDLRTVHVQFTNEFTFYTYTLIYFVQYTARTIKTVQLYNLISQHFTFPRSVAILKMVAIP